MSGGELDIHRHGGRLTSVLLRIRCHRGKALVAYDSLCWVGAYVVFALFYFDPLDEGVPWRPLALVTLATGALYIALAGSLRLHQGRANTASLEEMMLLGLVALDAGAIITALNLHYDWIPRTVPAAATLGALVAAAGGRAAWRRLLEGAAVGRGENSCRVLVVGAGEAGRDLVSSMLRDPARQWQPVGLLDDDPMKRHLRVRNVPVLGPVSCLLEAVGRSRAEGVVIAIPSASAIVIQRIRNEALQAGVPVKVLPSTTELLSDSVGIRDLRDVNIMDVLGRKQIDTDLDSIAGYLAGKRVLVTGAGGSIGAELCRQIHRFEPSELIMLDRDESALHAVQLSIHGHGLLDTGDVVLCDIRDPQAVEDVFAAKRPDVVFHAAALKHLPLLEAYPAEAVKANVLGTRTVLDASVRAGVERFVNISTDKAADPNSVLGYSKRIAECLTADRATRADGTFLSVRFGNVLGSRGSVLTSFASQIARGGPVTVTDPEVTRFFMTIEEACHLVIQAAAIGRSGEALVLDMGDPVRIVDVARQLIEQSGTSVDIEFTGLRPGEKLHEDLFGTGEVQNSRPVHPLVSHVDVPCLTDVDIEALPLNASAAEVRSAMADLALDAARAPVKPTLRVAG